MLLNPNTVRKDFITPWPYAYNTSSDHLDVDVLPQQLQDDQLPPNFLHDSQQTFIYNTQTQQQQQGWLGSPFQSPARPNFSPSSGSASPTFSSPVFSTARSPGTTVSGDFSTTYEGGLFEAQPMSVASSYNPSFHASSHQAPSPYPVAQYSVAPYQADASMLAQQGITTNTHGWDSDANIQLLSPAHAQNGFARRVGFQGAHKRAASGSSGKTGSHSPQTAAFTNQHNASSFPQSGNLNSISENNQGSKKSLPTPVQTPVQNSFLAPAFANYDPSAQTSDNAVVEQAMRQAVMEQHHHKPHQPSTDDDGSYHYSLAPSVSSLSHHNSPVTPQTTYDEFDDGSKGIVHDFNGQAPMPVGVPKLNRTISDVYQDELYNTTVIPTPQVRKPNPNQQLLSAPYRNLFADRLNAANQGHLSARSQSPVNNSINRERSPFRHGSPLAPEFRAARLQGSGLASAMQLPHTSGMSLGQPDNSSEVKTISPKDALLEYHEGPDEPAHGLPSLFPSNDFPMTGTDLTSRRPSANAFQPNLPYSQMESFPSQYATQAAGLQQQLNYLQQSPTRHNDNLIQTTPDFPATLTTMESTKSDSTPMEAQRPRDTTSDSGTYTCTYHGCTLRFETPAKLQKHKREAHRQAMPGQTTGHETANSLAMRNSQAGPHKCERINPSTGKPCNSIFSRPYDLTRHEDTIDRKSVV